QDGKLPFEHEGRTIWIADAHRDDGKRSVVRANEKLTACLELEWATRACGAIMLNNKRVKEFIFSLLRIFRRSRLLCAKPFLFSRCGPQPCDLGAVDRNENLRISRRARPNYTDP